MMQNIEYVSCISDALPLAQDPANVVVINTGLSSKESKLIQEGILRNLPENIFVKQFQRCKKNRNDDTLITEMDHVPMTSEGYRKYIQSDGKRDDSVRSVHIETIFRAAASPYTRTRLTTRLFLLVFFFAISERYIT